MTICGCSRARPGRYTPDQCVTCWAAMNRRRPKASAPSPIKFGATPDAELCAPLSWTALDVAPPTVLANPCNAGITASSGEGDGVDSVGCCDIATLTATISVTDCPSCTEILNSIDGLEITLTRTYVGGIPRWSGSASGVWPASGSGPCEWAITVNFTCGSHCLALTFPPDPTQQCLELILGFPGITDCISCAGCALPASNYQNFTGAIDCAAPLFEVSVAPTAFCDCTFTATVTL